VAGRRIGLQDQLGRAQNVVEVGGADLAALGDQVGRGLCRRHHLAVQAQHAGHLDHADEDHQHDRENDDHVDRRAAALVAQDVGARRHHR
jgi:hypothetical protein